MSKTMKKVDDKLMQLKLKLLEHLGRKATLEAVLYAEQMEYLVEETGHDQKQYLWYMDDKKEACIRIEDGEFITRYDINKVFCGTVEVD